MDITALFQMMQEASKATRQNYHLTLGDLIGALAKYEDDGLGGIPVRYEDGETPGEPMSYRGYYEDLAFDDANETVTVSTFLAKARAALGAEFDGYKGGEYTMGEDTALWRSEYGCASNEAIIGIIFNGDLVVIETKKLED